MLAKKTQRDKDWAMLRRLVEVDFHNRPKRPTTERIAFWLREARTPELLMEICRMYPGSARRLVKIRPALRWAIKGEPAKVEDVLRTEEKSVRAEDRAYWQPLRDELFQWRQERRNK